MPTGDEIFDAVHYARNLGKKYNVQLPPETGYVGSDVRESTDTRVDTVIWKRKHQAIASLMLG
jgi:hypothetical protein